MQLCPFQYQSTRICKNTTSLNAFQYVKALAQWFEKKLRNIQFKNQFKNQNFSETRCLKNTEKSLIQHCERSELLLHFKWTKVYQNAKNGPFWRVFEKLKLKAKIQKFKYDILSNF